MDWKKFAVHGKRRNVSRQGAKTQRVLSADFTDLRRFILFDRITGLNSYKKGQIYFTTKNTKGTKKNKVHSLGFAVDSLDK